MKQCSKCRIVKELDEFYKDRTKKDGYFCKCKVCAKIDDKKKRAKNMLNFDWREAQKKRQRDKYFELNYKGRWKPTKKQATIYSNNHHNKYPERRKAKAMTANMPRHNGYLLHHWSYNKEHWKDIIELSINDHYKIHRFLKYDNELLIFRIAKTRELLDTKKKHIDFIKSVIVYDQEFQDLCHWELIS